LHNRVGMRVQLLRGISALSLLTATACGDKTEPIPSTPTHLVVLSGNGQSGDLSATLPAPLVVQARDAANRAAPGVQIDWAVAGGGTISAAASTTGSDGNATVSWTLAATPGTQVVTATSATIAGSSVSFIATTGATLAGTVTAAPLGSNGLQSMSLAAMARGRLRGPSSSSLRSGGRRLFTDRIVIGFRDDALGASPVGSAAYRSMTAANKAATAMRQRLPGLTQRLPVADAEYSPALLAARVRVVDTMEIGAVMSVLRSDPAVAWVERDAVISIRDGAPRPMPVVMPSAAGATAGATLASSGIVLPNDPNLWIQYWHYNIIDLPRAWGIATGSAAVNVAVVDMGIRFDHADVKANLTNDGYDFVSQVGYTSTQPICDGTSFDTIDGDGDGPDSDPTDPDDLQFDPFGGCWVRSSLGDHGLWTAGIIGSVGNDQFGGTGVNWFVRIRPIRVLGITGEGTTFDVAQGVLYAAGLPATGKGGALVMAPTRSPIINMSLGGGFSSVMATAINSAVSAGSLVIASAGNDGLDVPTYPAALPNVMAVSAIGQDGQLATYSNAGSFVSVAAPGGDFRLDDNGGGGIIGPAWDFVSAGPTYVAGYGTSASAPHVAGIAALLLSQNPGLTAAALRQRIEQYASRPFGALRNDSFGWGIVNAYNSLVQQNGPTRQTIVRLIDATSGATVKSTTAASSGTFAFTRLQPGAYFVQAGQDENGDGVIGIPGRRFGWAGGFASPVAFPVAADQVQTTAITVGVPVEIEPNDDSATANRLSVGSYVTGQIYSPDVRDMYKVIVPVGGQYSFETSGLIGSCGKGIELDTVLQLFDASGLTQLSRVDNFLSATSHFCSKITMTLTAGTYYAAVTGTGASGLAATGRYRLEVRSGP
jgi:subtilisin family serine protease